jgi:peptidoglycan/LPS O-acetylase OafA/YrhL
LNHTGDINSYSVFSNLIVSVLIGWLLVLNIFYTDDAFYAFLNLKVISQIGVLSYSIYIWHLLIINPDVMPGFIAKFPQSLFFISAAALISYYGWEKQFLKLKMRFSIIRNKGIPE